jgi:anhydro-N-acetylmuramic acid kinase
VQDNFSAIAAKSSRLIIGLMSGTSADGVDAALMRLEGVGPDTRWKMLHFIMTPYLPDLRRRMLNLMHADAAEICRMNFLIGRVFGEATLALAKDARIRISEVDAIGSHGQTAYHIDSNGDRATLQIGEAAVIAEMTGCVVVSNFRARDIAAGGRGAPLVPFADYVMFRHPQKIRAMQNIGGIANVTILPPKLNDVTAFDTGPGNGLIDEAVRIVTNGKMDYDKDAAVAERGKVNGQMLEQLLSHPYFSQSPPKSTGKETFGREFVQALLAKYPRVAPEDLVATLTRFTAESIARAYAQFVLPKYDVAEIYVSGGGAHNPAIMRHLSERLAPIGVKTTDELGMPVDAKEAAAFAILANQTICGQPSNVPSATGAARPLILGCITLP